VKSTLERAPGKRESQLHRKRKAAAKTAERKVTEKKKSRSM